MDQWRVSNPGGCNLRSSPMFSTNIVGTLGLSSVVTVTGDVKNDFVPVQMWAHKSMLVPQSDVPYISQWSATANLITSDCGETCCLMLAQANGKATDKTVDDCVRLLKNYDGWTTPGDLVALLGSLGLPARTTNVLAPMTICLIDYSKVRPELKQDQGFAGHHWVLAISVGDSVVYHDPDFWGDATWKGANKSVSAVDFKSWCAGFYVCVA